MEHEQLYNCKCGLSFDDYSSAQRHLINHGLNINKDDINLKLDGRFKCSCGVSFTSKRCTVIRQRCVILTFKMKCKNCGNDCYPTYYYKGNLIRDDELQNLCSWISSLKGLRSNKSLYNPGIDHEEELCEACQLGLCVSYERINETVKIKIRKERIDRKFSDDMRMKLAQLSLSHDQIVSDKLLFNYFSVLDESVDQADENEI